MLNVSDEELIYLCREKNQIAISKLFERYSRYIYGFILKLYKLRNISFPINDLFQVCWIKFIECLDKYDQKSGKLYKFIQISLNHNLSDFLKYENHRYIDYSLDEFIDEDNKICFLDTISEKSEDYDLDNQVIANETKKKLFSILSLEEQEILKDRMNGYSYMELSSKYNKNYKSIDNQLSKIRRKLKELV